MVRNIIMIGAVALLSACGSDDSAVGGVSQGEADALNNAAALLDQPLATRSLTTPAKPRTKK